MIRYIITLLLLLVVVVVVLSLPYGYTLAKTTCGTQVD